MNRYFLRFSYIGTHFRGIQKTVNKAEGPRDDTTTVQGCIELALRVLRPVNPIEIVPSSRTDAGVHALESSVHVDLESRSGYPYGSGGITHVLNRQFEKHGHAIRVHSTQRVTQDFHCRYNAKGRTYLYRLALAKEPRKKEENLQRLNYIAFYPILEKYRCFFLQRDFNIEQFKEAANLFVGRHDFRTFMGSNNRNTRMNHPMYSLRTISEVIVRQGSPLTCSFEYEKACQLYDYWDVVITGKSFVYKQVRRIVGALMAVGLGELTVKDTYEMLTIPSKNSWPSHLSVMPPYGLYLCKVHYDEEDLKFPEGESDEQIVNI